MAFMRANHKKHGTSAANIRLSREERMNLYEILELDKVKNRYYVHNLRIVLLG